MSDLRIVMATPSAGYEQRIRRALDTDLVGVLQRWDSSALSPVDVVRQLDPVSPDVVAIGPDVELDDALKIAKQLETDRPEISVLLVSEPTGELWRSALRAGVTDVLAPDATDADVREVYDRAIEVAVRRRHNLVGASESLQHGRIVTVLSPKGGSGKTTVCANLAFGLSQAAPDQVAVVDLDTQFGDISTALRLTPEHTLADAAVVGTCSDSLALKSFLTPHSSSLWSLCAPDSPADGERVQAEQARHVVEQLAQEFDFVVVDTCAGLTEHTLAVLDVSTDLVLVCGMDVASVRSMRKEIDALDQLGLTQARRHFIINRADSKVGLELRDVEATVGLPVDVALPSSRIVPLSMNQGTPVLESQPRTPVGKQLSSLVGRFVTEQASTQEPEPRLRRRRRRETP